MGLFDYVFSLLGRGSEPPRTLPKAPFIIFSIVTLLGITHILRTRSRKKNLPPGPKGFPILGSLSLFRIIGLLK